MLRRGQVVRVEFLDHVEGGSQPAQFAVYGEVASVTRKAISVDSWCYADKKQPHDGNETRYVILRSAIVKVAQLKEVKNGSGR